MQDRVGSLALAPADDEARSEQGAVIRRDPGRAKPGRFLALDSCRGLCAVAVMLFHLDAVTHFYGWPPVRNAWVAVDFFFTLSGFVIASAYFAKLGTLEDATRLAVRRFGRLYPLHIAVLAVFVAIEAYRLWRLHAADAFSDNTSVRALVEQLFLIQGFTANHETWNYPAWSISIELWVNFAFAFLAVIFRRVFLGFVFLLLAAGATLILMSDSWTGFFASEQADAMQDAVRSAFEFLLGFVAFRLYAFAQARGWKPWRFAEFAVVPLVAVAFGYAGALPALASPAIFLAVVLLLSFEAGPLSAFLRLSPLTALGTYSYSIYLTHALYLMGLEAAVTAIAAQMGVAASTDVGGDTLLTLGGPWAMDGAGLACVAVAIFGSSLTYRFIEEPARTFFNRLSSFQFGGDAVQVPLALPRPSVMTVADAVAGAKRALSELFAEENVSAIALEEAEFDAAARVWSVTLGLSRKTDAAEASARSYKVVCIQDGDGHLLSVKSTTAPPRH